MNTLSDYLKSINETKEYIFEKESYLQYAINICLARVESSFHVVNAINEMKIPDSMHYRFLLQVLPKAKRFGEAYKKKEDKNLEMICQYYECNNKRGKEILELLSKEQIKKIKSLLPQEK